MIVSRHLLARFLVTAILVTAIGAPAFADDLSKEACVDAHSRGQDAREQGKLSLARKLFLSCAQSSCPTLVQGDCARFADDLTRMQPTLSFVARDGAGADLPDTTIYIDGVLTVTQLDDGKAHDVDPGPHTIKFIHDGKDQVQTIVVGAGEKGRTVAVMFGEAVVPAALGGAAKRKVDSGPRVTHPTGAKIVVGLGAAMVVGGGALGIFGLTRVPDNCSLSTHQCAAPPGDKSFADASSAIGLSNIGWVVSAVGVVAIAGGVAWYVGGKHTDKETNVVAAPWFTPDAAGFAVMGHL
jgi:hypothetical protein